jgi:hypothetical protein
MSASALQPLRKLLPPDCVIHVGAGRGLGEIHAWRDWGIQRAWLIDADGDRMAWASKEQDGSAWQVLQAVVSDKSGPVDFYQASNPAEDGLLPPDRLRAQWANLRTISRRKATACTLDDLLPSSAPANNAWLFIDCLPANLVLKGATQALAHTRVVCARALGIQGDQATDQVLAAQGFVQVARLESNHPDVGHLLYARDMLAHSESLAQSLAKALDEQNKSQRAAAQLQAEHGAQCMQLAAQIDQLKAENQTLKVERDSLVATHEADAQAHAQALDHRDEQNNELTKELHRVQLVLLALEEETLAAAQECDELAKANREAHDSAQATELDNIRLKQQVLELEEKKEKFEAALTEQNKALTDELERVKLCLQDLDKEKTAILAARESDASGNAKKQAELQAQLTECAQSNAELQNQLSALKEVQSDLQDQLGAITQAQVGLQSELDKAAKRHAQLEAERDALAQARTSEAEAKELALQERDALAQAKTALQTQLEALEKAIADSQAQLGIKNKAQSDLQDQLGAITQAQVGLQSELDKAAKRLGQLEAERDALGKAKEAETAAKNKAITEKDALTKEKQTEASKHKEKQERIEQLEAINQDLQHRQNMQHEELVKAEAQIELIKELLLHEQGI